LQSQRAGYLRVLGAKGFARREGGKELEIWLRLNRA